MDSGSSKDDVTEARTPIPKSRLEGGFAARDVVLGAFEDDGSIGAKAKAEELKDATRSAESAAEAV